MTYKSCIRFLLPFTLLVTVFNLPVWGTIIPFSVRHNSQRNALERRGAHFNVTNNGNAQYIANITVGGAPVRVLLDTGSSDLWVSFPGKAPMATGLGKNLTLTYAVGSASGQASSAAVQLGGYIVDNQAFLFVGNTSSFSSDIHQQGYDGLLGLGPNSGSILYKKLKGSIGDTTLINIFQQNSSSSSDNYITLLLSRNSDPMATYTGQLTINEMVPGFENITSMPKLDLETVNRLLSRDQHWQALTDVNGIIGPDGNPIVTKSIVPKAPHGQLVAVFDSGFTFSQVPRDVSDAIYGRVQGAVYDTAQQIWTVPCGQYMNIAVQFGGRSYPIHPLDSVDDNFSYTYSNGTRACIGAFQPITSAFSILGHYDMILGMSFLRNVHTRLNFGSWANGNSDDHPSIQLAPLTNTVLARQDFINIRLGSIDTTGAPQWALLPANQMQHSPVSAAEKKAKQQEKILSRWPYILLGCFVLVTLILGLCIWKCCCRNRCGNNKSKRKAVKATQDPFSTEPASQTYLPLAEPSHSQGVYTNGKYPSNSAYSLETTYDTPGGQYPPGMHYHGAGQYPPEPRSPNRGTHSFDTPQHPPPEYASHNPYGPH